MSDNLSLIWHRNRIPITQRGYRIIFSTQKYSPFSKRKFFFLNQGFKYEKFEWPEIEIYYPPVETLKVKICISIYFIKILVQSLLFSGDADVWKPYFEGKKIVWCLRERRYGSRLNTSLDIDEIITKYILSLLLSKLGFNWRV